MDGDVTEILMLRCERSEPRSMAKETEHAAILRDAILSGSLLRMRGGLGAP
jgi:hypothetical protein